MMKKTIFSTIRTASSIFMMFFKELGETYGMVYQEE
jgi:hypothetical protein